MNNIKIMNYNSETFDTGIAIEDVDHIHVTVVSGDELLDIHLKNGEVVFFDSADLANNRRFIDYYDGSYSVDQEDFENWNQRKSSYDENWRKDTNDEDEDEEEDWVYV